MKLRALFLPLVMVAVSFAADNAFLPSQFAGWQVTGEVKTSRDPAIADSTNPALLEEYGFTDFNTAVYSREEGKLTVKAARFADATGAYGSYTYYKLPQMLNEKIGDYGSSLNERILFYRGNILVDAVFERLTAMSAAQLRELANLLPRPSGSNGNLPLLPTYLPKQAYQKNSAKYVIGPVGLARIGSPLPASLVDFGAGAEVALGKFDTAGGDATLELISYPTPQIATEHLKRIDAARQSPSLSQTGQTFARRTGPLVVFATGALSEGEGKALVGAVNYEADVTWNEKTDSGKENVGKLIVNALLLCAILIGFALVIGVAFGGARILIRRLLPENALASGQDAEFISLHLEEPASTPAEPKAK